VGFQPLLDLHEHTVTRYCHTTFKPADARIVYIQQNTQLPHTHFFLLSLQHHSFNHWMELGFFFHKHPQVFSKDPDTYCMEVNMTYLILKPNSVNNVWTDLVYTTHEGQDLEGIDYGYITEDKDKAYTVAWMAYNKFVIENQ
jgi:hypothetical protein